MIIFANSFKKRLDIYKNLSVSPATFGDASCNLYSFYMNNFHGDLLWNIFNTFAPYKRDRFFQLVPYASFAFGLSESETRKKTFRRDFMAGLGVSANLHVTAQLSLNVDYRGYHMAGRKYGHVLQNHSIITDLSFGAAYQIRNKPWKVADQALVVSRRTPKFIDKEGPLISDHFLYNSFFSLSEGVNCTFDQGMYAAPAMELLFGKWVSPMFGFKLGVGGLNIAERENEVGFVNPHVDVMINVINWKSLYSSVERKAVDIAPYVGLGYLGCYTRDSSAPERISSEASFDAGLLTMCRIGRRGTGSADLRYTKSGSRYFVTGSFGLGYYIGGADWNPHRTLSVLDGKTREENVTRVKGYIANVKLFDNTFVSYMAGANTFDFDGAGMAMDLSAGKWFTPAIGFRFGYQGRNSGRSGGDVYKKVNTNLYHIDLMWNPLSTFVGFKPGRVFEPALYAQVGLFNFRNPIGDSLGNDVGVGDGFLGRFKVSDRLDLTMDLKGLYVKDRFTCSSEKKTLFASAMAGVSYDFGYNTWDAGRGESLQDRDYSDDRARYLAVSTNILGYADLLTLNLEFQYALNRHWSLTMQGKSNNFIFNKNSDNQFMDRKSTASLGAKYWPWYVYCGFWAQGFLRMEGYSRSHLTKNMSYENGDAYGGGLAMGYSILVNRWFNIDLGAGVWAGYDKPKVGGGKAFVGLSDISVSAMFVF